MNLNDQRPGSGDDHIGTAERVATLATEVRERCAGFEVELVRRDWIEALAAVFVVAFCAMFLRLEKPTPLMTLGVVIVMLGAVEIVAVMFWTRRRDPRPRPDSSMFEFSTAEVTRLDRQIGLLRCAFWWYSAPVLLGVATFLCGVLRIVPNLSGPIWVALHAAFLLCLVWVAMMLQRVHQRHVDCELVPLRDQIAEFQQGAS